jgi:hypothetical protein
MSRYTIRGYKYGDTECPMSKLQDLENKIEDGVLVELPCKVGDMVHAKAYWWVDGTYIADYQITNITITQNKKGEWTRKYRAMRFFDGKTWDRQLNFSFDEIGKTVFLTRDAAEKALSERGGNV